MPAKAITPTVFVVDDDLDLRESLGVLLRALGREVREFSSADAFQKFFDGSQPGCLVLDISMPGRSGLELYADLIASGHRIPVIFITAHADVSTAVAAMKTGAIEFLEKPFDRETISNRIDQALELDARWRTNEARFQALDERVRQLNKSDVETLGFLLAGAPNKERKPWASAPAATAGATPLKRMRVGPTMLLKR